MTVTIGIYVENGPETCVARHVTFKPSWLSQREPFWNPHCNCGYRLFVRDTSGLKDVPKGGGGADGAPPPLGGCGAPAPQTAFAPRSAVPRGEGSPEPTSAEA